MPNTLKTKQESSRRLYRMYLVGTINLEEYKKSIKRLDDDIDELELQSFGSSLEGNFACEISSLKHLH